MEKPVKIAEIIDEIGCQSDELHAYLNRKTGELIMMQDEYLSMAEDDEAEIMTEWEKDEVEQARAILETDDYLALPDRYEIDEYRMMEDFIRGQEDDRARELLAVAIRGRGAFRRFKDTAHRLGIIEDWYRYRDGELRNIAVEWCEANGITYDEGDLQK